MNNYKELTAWGPLQNDNQTHIMGIPVTLSEF